AGKRLRLDPADLDTSDEYRQAFETERNIAPPHAMRASIEHLQREYGGVRPYLTGTGVTEEELERLRAAMVVCGSLKTPRQPSGRPSPGGLLGSRAVCEGRRLGPRRTRLSIRYSDHLYSTLP
ncbi:MAG: tyrosine-protein phosphatase, partial [Chloroflexota bacterium]|nr:tyrosine-protein phosphatase [Chloroflexota bacterium]